MTFGTGYSIRKCKYAVFGFVVVVVNAVFVVVVFVVVDAVLLL